MTTPDRVFQCSMSVTKLSGRCSGPTWSRKAVFGCREVTTTLASISSPRSRITPVARPVPGAMAIFATRASVLIVTPADRAALAMAAATPSMPPSGNPQLPRCPSPTSPIEWCAIT